ncbi:MAG: FHA domain-containing protein [Planctomycetota bacterium]
MPHLIVVTEGVNKEPVTITIGNEGIIGREKSNNIYIDDPRASRQHAKITKEPDDSYLLVDMGSRNGMIVNGEKVSRRKLIDKDLIVIGRTTLTYSVAVGPRCPSGDLLPTITRSIESTASNSESASVQAPVQPSAPAETLKITSDDPSRLGGTSDKTITAEPAKLGSDALKKAIQDVAAANSDDKTATGSKKTTPVSSPGAVPAGSGIPKSMQVIKTTPSGGTATDEEPSLGKRIVVFLAFLIFFVTILLFAKEITKKLLSKAEKPQPTPNISFPEKIRDK